MHAVSITVKWRATQFPSTEIIWGMGTSFRRNDSWHRLGGRALVIIG